MRHYLFRLAVHPDSYFSLCRVASSPRQVEGGITFAASIPAPGDDNGIVDTNPSEGVAGRDTLGLSVASNSRTRSRRGLRGLTAHGKRMLRNASAIMDRYLSRKRVALITCTIPSDDPTILMEIAAKAAQITDSLSHKLQLRLRKRGLPQWVAGCWELQERGALHIHWIIPSCTDRRRQDWVITKDELCALWRETLCHICPALADANWTPSTRIESIKQSIARYLSKYISKGGSPGRADYCPSSWYHVSRALRQVISDSTLVQYWTSPRWGQVLDTVASALPVVTTRLGVRLLSLVSLPAKYREACWGISGYSTLSQDDLVDSLLSIIAPLSLQEIKGMPISSIPAV